MGRVCLSEGELRLIWLVTGMVVEKEITTWFDEMGVIKGVVYMVSALLLSS